MLRVRFEFLHRRLSQGPAARAMGLSQGVLSEILTGRRIPTRRELALLADYLGLPPDRLMLPVKIVEDDAPVSATEHVSA